MWVIFLLLFSNRVHVHKFLILVPFLIRVNTFMEINPMWVIHPWRAYHNVISYIYIIFTSIMYLYSLSLSVVVSVFRRGFAL